MAPASRCVPCGIKFARPRDAYYHWLNAHSRLKLGGDGERAVLAALRHVRTFSKQKVED
jgi:hypothetical protein